ncbi:hypothetical protein PRIC2_006336 [Phytophthora ramorum]
MGCSHSKTSDQVVERVSVDTPAVEAPAPESIKEPEVAIEESEDLPPASASVPVEEAPKTEEPAPVEEEPAAPVEEEPAAPVEEEPAAPVEEEPAAPVEEVGAEPTENEAAEESVIPEEKPVEEEVVEAVEEAPKTEEKTPEPEETPVEAEAEAPKSEAPVEEETPNVVKPIDGSLTFTPEAVTFNDKGVAFYNFNGSDSSNPANDVHVSKRYSEFKALHAQLSAKVPDLPALPRASFLLGRKNKKMLDDRETQFTALLNAVAADPVASQSDAFKTFLA